MPLPLIAASKVGAVVLVAAALSVFVQVAEPFALTLDGPALNHVDATPTIATAGMPTRRQLQMLAGDHVAVINLAPAEALGSHDDEQAVVERAGARYVHIPVDFGQPRNADYERFAQAMRALKEQRVLVHCQMNMRASVFVFLYRAIELGEDPERAYDDVLKVWQPNVIWARFIRDQLQAHGIAVPLAAA